MGSGTFVPVAKMQAMMACLAESMGIPLLRWVSLKGWVSLYFSLLVWSLGVRSCRSLVADVVRSTGGWSRIVAIGDVHGDFGALKECLVSASVFHDGEWIAQEKTLVLSCGDVVDRGEEDWKCLKFLRQLKEEALAKGSDVAMLLGNHEVLNVDGCMDFVNDQDDLGMDRKAAFQPGGQAALLLAELCGETPLVRVEGDTVFVHAALPSVGIDDVNQRNSKIKDWILQASTALDDPFRWDSVYDDCVWSRDYVHVDNNDNQISDAIKALDCNRVVSGHNVMRDGINCVHVDSTTVYRIDTGMSSWVCDGPKQVLELIPGIQPRLIGAQGTNTTVPTDVS